MGSTRASSDGMNKFKPSFHSINTDARSSGIESTIGVQPKLILASRADTPDAPDTTEKIKIDAGLLYVPGGGDVQDNSAIKRSNTANLIKSRIP